LNRRAGLSLLPGIQTGIKSESLPIGRDSGFSFEFPYDPFNTAGFGSIFPAVPAGIAPVRKTELGYGSFIRRNKEYIKTSQAKDACL
jgi:hypothetical protein